MSVTLIIGEEKGDMRQNDLGEEVAVPEHMSGTALCLPGVTCSSSPLTPRHSL